MLNYLGIAALSIFFGALVMGLFYWNVVYRRATRNMTLEQRKEFDNGIDDEKSIW